MDAPIITKWQPTTFSVNNLIKEFENKLANIPPILKNINPILAKYRGAFKSFDNHRVDQSIIIPPEPKTKNNKNPNKRTLVSGILNFSPSPLKSKFRGNPIKYTKIFKNVKP